MDEKTTHGGELEAGIPIIPPSEIKALEEEALKEKRRRKPPTAPRNPSFIGSKRTMFPRS